MPSGQNWVNFLYVNIAFVIYLICIFYYSQAAQVKANWPLYRCNPMYMGLADNIEENFSYCIQNMQGNYMGYLLQPLTHVTNSLTTTMGGFSSDIQNIRAMFSKIRTFFTTIIQSVFGIFLNLIIEFQRITIGIKDLIGKTIGIMVSMMYILDGSVKTMNSSWNGPPGQMVRSLGKCFHPNTIVELQNGNCVCMKDLNLGDVLKDGSIVETTLKINNTNRENFYVIPNKKNNTDILVTGSHLVYDSQSNKFIKVENYKNAKYTNITTEWFSCVITDTHSFYIGNERFWDWEDHFLKMCV